MAPPPVPKPGSLRLKSLNLFTGATVIYYRLSGGRIGGKLAGAPVLLVDHIGRKSGKHRTTPLLYLDDGDDLVIVGSRGGSDATPTASLRVVGIIAVGAAWRIAATGGTPVARRAGASPATTVQVGHERRDVIARQATTEERARLWPRLTAMYPDYDVYQRRTEREIPVIILTPP